MSLDLKDPIAIAEKLIRCPSVTPDAGQALDVLEQVLKDLGFTCERVTFTQEGFDPVDNLYARLGEGEPNFCFAGHLDVVPEGDRQAWETDPFQAVQKDGRLYGRGAADMKAAIACFCAAVAEFGKPEKGSISFLITGDEEGVAVNGTVKLLEHITAKGEKLTHCLVGEPTNPEYLGQMMKVGRRGSMTFDLTVRGTQGHVAYPHLADNPVHKIAPLMQVLTGEPLDAGNEYFQPSSLQFVTVDTGNEADNVIPASVHVRFNIRFNNLHTSDSLKKWVEDKIKSLPANIADYTDVKVRVSGESFLSPQDNDLIPILSNVCHKVTGHLPEASTTGGTSDARFIRNYCPVVEFGLVGQSMHKVNENVRLADIEDLKKIYLGVLGSYFKANDA